MSIRLYLSPLQVDWLADVATPLYIHCMATCDANRIGCITTPKDFCVSGTASEKLFGVAEGLWEPDLVRGTRSRPRDDREMSR